MKCCRAHDILLYESHVDVLDHLEMVVQGLEDSFAGNALRQRGDGGEDGPFRHFRDYCRSSARVGRLVVPGGEQNGEEMDLYMIPFSLIVVSCMHELRR